MEYPKILRDFDKTFYNDEACLRFLEQVRWQKEFKCQKCGGDKYWTMATGLRRCQECRFKNSVKVGSIFESSRLPIKTWFQAIWWVTVQKNGVSALGFQKNIGIGSYETSWLLFHKIRNAMIHADRTPLKGDVEVDEAFVGGVHSGKRGRGSEGKELVVIAAEFSGKSRIGRIRMQRIPDASAKSLETFIKANILQGSTVHTDGWPSYGNIDKLGYKHVPKKSATVHPDDLLPRVNSVTAHLKRWLMGTLHGSFDPKHIDSYLEEFVFRFNRRNSKARGLLFQRVLENSIRVKPAPYQEIIKGKL